MRPSTKDSWCKLQIGKANGTNAYKEKPVLPKIVRHAIRPIFVSLSDDNLFNKCSHEKTRNINEPLNGFIWRRSPKDVLVGRVTLELGVASAIIAFNDGFEVFNNLNKIPEKFCEKLLWI